MSNRRDFLKAAGTFAAGALIFPNLAFKADKAIGIQLFSLRDQLPGNVKSVLEKIAAAGYKNVEVFGYSAKQGFWGIKPKEFRALLKDVGLKSSSGHYDADKFLNSGGKDDYALKDSIQAAALLKHKYFTMPGFGGKYSKSADGFKNVAALFNKVAEYAKSAGLKTAYHNHDFEFASFGDTTGYEILLKETDPSLVHMEADLYWMVRAGKDPLELFAKYPGRFVMWHVKDMDKTHHNLNTEIGSGIIQFDKIFEKQALAGVETIFVEQENYINIDPYISIAKSADYIKHTLFKR